MFFPLLLNVIIAGMQIQNTSYIIPHISMTLLHIFKSLQIPGMCQTHLVVNNSDAK